MDFDFGTSEPKKEENNDNQINNSQPSSRSSSWDDYKQGTSREP